MAKYFESDDNPVLGIFISYVLSEDKNLFDEENFNYLGTEIHSFLKYTLNNSKDADLLKFSVDHNTLDDSMTILAENLITGLWFCGIFPEDCKKVESDGEYVYLGKKYTLNKRKKNLKIVEL